VEKRNKIFTLVAPVRGWRDNLSVGPKPTSWP